MDPFLYDVYTRLIGRGIWEVKAVSRCGGDTYTTDTTDSISIDNYRSEEEARRLEGYRVLLYYTLRDNGREVTTAPAEEEIKAALIACKIAPDKLPLSGNYAILLSGYIWYAFGGDLSATEEARNILGAAVGKDIIDYYTEVAPDLIESITPEDIASHAAKLAAALSAITKG